MSGATVAQAGFPVEARERSIRISNQQPDVWELVAKVPGRARSRRRFRAIGSIPARRQTNLFVLVK
jgi:hypothetical protein